MEERLIKVENRINTHEKVCAERYSGINGRLKRMELWLLSIVGAAFSLLTLIAVKVI